MEQRIGSLTAKDLKYFIAQQRAAMARFDRIFQSYLRARHLKAGFDPDQPRDDHGRWTESGSAEDQQEATAPNLDHLLDGLEGYLDSIGYQGRFHDDVVEYLVQGMRAGGSSVETEVRLILPGTNPVEARIDILGRNNHTGQYFGVEVKTGEQSGFTAAQRLVYPHVVGGAGVISPDQKIIGLGLIPWHPLPPISIDEVFVAAPGSQLRISPIKPVPKR